MTTIRELLADIDFRDKYEANVLSATAAQGVHHLIQYLHRQVFGDKDVPKTEPQNFLPFPTLKAPGEADEDSLLKPQTKKIIESLAATGRIPAKVKEALLKVPPSLKAD